MAEKSKSAWAEKNRTLPEEDDSLSGRSDRPTID